MNKVFIVSSVAHTISGANSRRKASIHGVYTTFEKAVDIVRRLQKKYEEDGFELKDDSSLNERANAPGAKSRYLFVSSMAKETKLDEKKKLAESVRWVILPRELDTYPENIDGAGNDF